MMDGDGGVVLLLPTNSWGRRPYVYQQQLSSEVKAGTLFYSIPLSFLFAGTVSHYLRKKAFVPTSHARICRL
jgi:hypothetical protein